LLADEPVNYKVPWTLGEIGGPAGINYRAERQVAVNAIHSLENLDARKALPFLNILLADGERCHFDVQESVSEAARGVIAKLASR
jgi:hypothetical protein